MKQYLDLLKKVLDHGVRQSNRTGIDTFTIPGEMLRFDLREGFPAVTTKQLFFNAVKGELIGFLRGCDSAAEFRALGFKKWDGNANEDGVDAAGNVVPNAWLRSAYRKGPDDLGRLGYSHGWRRFGANPAWASGNTSQQFPGIDQIAVALITLRNNPESRRILVSAWNPAELDQAALPPCHVLFQLLPHIESKTLHMTMYQRSVDTFLGLPFNIASYALLLELFAAWSGYKAGTLTMFLADVHIYENHVDQVIEQLNREPLPLPKLVLEVPVHPETCSLEQLLAHLQPDCIGLADYQHHPAILAPMAV